MCQFCHGHGGNKFEWKDFRTIMLKLPNVSTRNANGDTDTLSISNTSDLVKKTGLPKYSGGNWNKLFEGSGGLWNIGSRSYLFQNTYKLKDFPFKKFIEVISTIENIKVTDSKLPRGCIFDPDTKKMKFNTDNTDKPGEDNKHVNICKEPEWYSLSLYGTFLDINQMNEAIRIIKKAKSVTEAELLNIQEIAGKIILRDQYNYIKKKKKEDLDNYIKEIIEDKSFKEVAKKALLKTERLNYDLAIEELERSYVKELDILLEGESVLGPDWFYMMTIQVVLVINLLQGI